MKIGVYMIVKNEEEMLSRCLDSIKDFDAIYIADTGSEDKTVEIARKYTKHVYTSYKWEDSFCKARNFILSKIWKRDDIDWLLVIDADEYLNNNYEEVKRVLEQADVDVVNTKVTAETTGVTHTFPRLHRNKREIFWKNDVHNLLNMTSRVYSDIEIIYGYSPAHKKDPDRAMRILLKVLAEHPEKVRERYYLAKEYQQRKWWEKAVDMYDHYLKDATQRNEIADAYLMRARCYWYMEGNHGEDARLSCIHAIYTNPDFKEALLFMAEMNFEPRKTQWERFAKLAKNEDVLFVRKK